MSRLEDLLDPRSVAVVTSEVQRGVLGQDAIFPALAEQARSEGLVERLERLVQSARAVEVPVVHGVAHRRPDGRGASSNARLFAAAAKAPVALVPGTPAAGILPTLYADEDLVSSRLHGIGPFAGTDLDSLLRNLGVTTVVVAGASVNVAITNLVMDLVNGGYQVVLPRDAVTGIPREYADQLIDNTLALLATVTTVDEVVDRWTGF